jgi:hypothetical protein
MGGRSAFADKAAEAAALPDEAAAEVLSPSSSVKYGDFAVGSDPAGTAAGSKGVGGLLDKQGSAGLQQQQLLPQPPNRPPSDVVLVKVRADQDSSGQAVFLMCWVYVERACRQHHLLCARVGMCAAVHIVLTRPGSCASYETGVGCPLITSV